MTAFRIFPNSAHRSRLLYRFSSPSRFISSFSARSAGFSGSCHLSVSGQNLCQPRLPLRAVASGLRHRRSAFSICCWAAGEKKSTRPASFSSVPASAPVWTPDRMVSGYLLGSALLGLQRLSFTFSWLYLSVRGGRFRHRGRALGSVCWRHRSPDSGNVSPQSAPWIKHPASAALCRRLRGCAHFSKPRSRHYLPLR